MLLPLVSGFQQGFLRRHKLKSSLATKITGKLVYWSIKKLLNLFWMYIFQNGDILKKTCISLVFLCETVSLLGLTSYAKVSFTKENLENTKIFKITPFWKIYIQNKFHTFLLG